MSKRTDSKRYFWLKLNENFFEREEIKIIEDMKNGKDYIIFYMKLLLKSVAMEGKLIFRDIIPYTPEMLASITNTDVDTVRVATDLFLNLGLMEKWDDGTLFMSETQNMIGSETGWAKKKRLQRQNKDNVLECPTEIDIELDIEKEIETHTEQEKETIKKVVCVLDKKVTFSEANKILKISSGDIDLIKEKYDIAKAIGYKNLIAVMLKAIKEDWQIPKEQDLKSNINTKFHNFESRTSKYSAEELEKKVLNKNNK